MINGVLACFRMKQVRLPPWLIFIWLQNGKPRGQFMRALKLARPESKRILIVGAGTVGHSLRAAYGAGFPDAEFLIWNRTATTAEAFPPNTQTHARYRICRLLLRWPISSPLPR